MVTISDNRSSADGSDTLKDVEFALFNDRIFALPSSAAPVPKAVGNPHVAPLPTLETLPTSLTLKGGRKADHLIGGAGDDNLNGGLGLD